MPIHLTKIMCKKKSNYNSLVTRTGLIMKKNKFHLSFIYHKILHALIFASNLLYHYYKLIFILLYQLGSVLACLKKKSYTSYKANVKELA